MPTPPPETNAPAPAPPAGGSSLFTGLRGVADRQREKRFADLHGAAVEGTLPLREGLLNEAVQVALAGKPMPLRDLRITLPGGSRVVADFTVVVLFAIPMRLVLDIDEVIDFAADPTVRLRIAAGSGLTGALLGVVSKVVSALPDEITIDDRVIRVDVRHGLERRGLGDLLPLLRWARVRGERGRLLIDFRVAVEG